MGSQGTGSQFRTTSWTLIVGTKSSQEDLERLLGLYWRPVYAYLRRKGNSQHDAADFTQAFFVDVVLSRDLIGRADPNRGRFRWFLLSALKKFLIDEHRRVHGRRGVRSMTFLPADPANLEIAEPKETDDPTRSFDRQWATTVLSIALARSEEACRAEGLARHWTVFEKRKLHPALYGVEPEPVPSLVQRVEAAGPDEIYSMDNTVRRKFASVLAEVVAETVDNPAEVEQELADVRTFLSR